MKTFKYFSNCTELKGTWAERNEFIVSKFPGMMFKRSDSFHGLVGTVDGKYDRANCLLVDRVVRYKTDGSKHKCDARCLNAKGHNCECSCGGKNHGAGNQ